LVPLGGKEALQALRLILVRTADGPPDPVWKSKLDEAVKTVTGE